MSKKTLYFLVTNSLHQDQRLHRIASTLSEDGYNVIILAINNSNKENYQHEGFQCHSIRTWFKSGFLFYLELNFRFFLALIFKSNFDAVVANDIDTILAAKTLCLLRRKKMIIDLHEYYAETPEVHDRKIVKAFWNSLSNLILPRNKYNYTVNNSLATLFKDLYRKDYTAIYNFPIYQELNPSDQLKNPKSLSLVYVGMVNKGRGLFALLHALKQTENIVLTILGKGDELEQIDSYISENGLADKVKLQGFVASELIHHELQKHDIGINLLDANSMSYYYSSANKYFDYIMAGIPSISMAFPEYISFNKKYETAVLIDNLDTKNIITALRILSSDDKLHARLKANCLEARAQFNWKSQKSKLLEFYESVC